MKPDAEAFERTFVALTYLLGRRDALCSGLLSPGDGARRMAELLSTPERTERARRLSEELSPLATALAARGPS